MMSSGCWWGWPGHFFGGPFGIIVGVLFWALMIYGIIYLVTHFAKHPAGADARQETPMEILKRRYARGEIDAEEFARRKRDIES